MKARCRIVKSGGAVLLLLLGGTTQAAPLPQAACSGSTPIPVDIGASEFDKSFSDGTSYGLNEWYPWWTYTNANTVWMQTHVTNFNTEANYDYLSVNGTMLTGNLGTQWFPTTFGKPFLMEWKSDGSIIRTGIPKIDQVTFTCLPSNQQVTTAPINPVILNYRFDVLFPFQEDVAYFSVDQPATSPLMITVDNIADEGQADYDIFASATVQRPGKLDATWLADRPGGHLGQGSEALIIPSSGGSRKIYFGVHNYRGVGHVAVRASRVDADRTLTICTQEDFTPAQLMSHPNWPAMKRGLIKAMLLVMPATNGNMWKDNIRIKRASSILPKDPGNAFCQKDSGCDWCMTSFGHQADPQPWDGCGYQADPSSGRVRIPNVRCAGADADPFHGGTNWDAPDNMGYVLSHEAGHGLARMGNHSGAVLLPDEYGAGGAPQCGHSVMNGPQITYRYCTAFNHCQVGDPASSPSCGNSAWTIINNSGAFPGWVFPDPARSAQPWLWLQTNETAIRAIDFTAI